jgi:hypothetical protein
MDARSKRQQIPMKSPSWSIAVSDSSKVDPQPLAEARMQQGWFSRLIARAARWPI